MSCRSPSWRRSAAAADTGPGPRGNPRPARRRAAGFRIWHRTTAASWRRTRGAQLLVAALGAEPFDPAPGRRAGAAPVEARMAAPRIATTSAPATPTSPFCPGYRSPPSNSPRNSSPTCPTPATPPQPPSCTAPSSSATTSTSPSHRRRHRNPHPVRHPARPRLRPRPRTPPRPAHHRPGHHQAAEHHHDPARRGYLARDAPGGSTSPEGSGRDGRDGVADHGVEEVAEGVVAGDVGLGMSVAVGGARE